MRIGKFLRRFRPVRSGNHVEPEAEAAGAEFERLPEFESIIAAARRAESLPVPPAFTDSVLQSIYASAEVMQSKPNALVEKWVFASSQRELGQCFLVTGFFYLVLALTLYGGLQFFPEASDWLHWQAAAGLTAALLCGAAGGFLVAGGSLAVRIAELTAIAGILLLVFAAAIGPIVTVRPPAMTATALFVSAASGPLLFLITAAHRFQTRTGAATGAWKPAVDHPGRME